MKRHRSSNSTRRRDSPLDGHDIAGGGQMVGGEKPTRVLLTTKITVLRFVITSNNIEIYFTSSDTLEIVISDMAKSASPYL